MTREERKVEPLRAKPAKLRGLSKPPPLNFEPCRFLVCWGSAPTGEEESAIMMGDETSAH